jgi:hypothetical protein
MLPFEDEEAPHRPYHERVTTYCRDIQNVEDITQGEKLLIESTMKRLVNALYNE